MGLEIFQFLISVGYFKGTNQPGLHDVLGSSDNIRGGWLGDGLLSGHDVLVSANNTGHSGLDGLGSNNSVLHPVLYDGGAGSVAMVGLADHGGGGGHWCGDQRAVVGGSSHGNSQEGE